jgi:hypothetical protein
MKYGVTLIFCRKLAICAKTVGQNLWIFRENLNFLKLIKNSYIRPLCRTNSEYGGHDHEIRSSGQFLPQTDDLQ